MFRSPAASPSNATCTKWCPWCPCTTPLWPGSIGSASSAPPTTASSPVSSTVDPLANSLVSDLVASSELLPDRAASPFSGLAADVSAGRFASALRVLGAARRFAGSAGSAGAWASGCSSAGCASGFLASHALTHSEAPPLRLSAGSQVSSAAVYPTQRTLYSTPALPIRLPTTFCTSNTTSDSVAALGSGAPRSSQKVLRSSSTCARNSAE